jgi:AcrR family transcriptional regulator
MGVDVPGRRDRKKQQTRAALITAALRLVDERGLDRVTVEEISEAADVSSRTFFNYFATKDEALIGDPITDGPDFKAALLAQPTGLTVVEAIRRALAPTISDIQQHLELWRLRMRVIGANPSLLPALFARGAQVEAELVAAIAERTGHPADSPFTQLTATLTGTAFRTAMIRWATVGQTSPFAELVDEAFAFLSSGLAEPWPATRENQTEESR